MGHVKTCFVGALLALSATLPAYAGNTGLEVTGTLAFNGGGQYWANQDTTIGSGPEYVYRDGANTDVANFTDTQLKITDYVKTNAGTWEMTFATPAGFESLSLVSSNFAPGLSYTVNDGTIVLDWAGIHTGPHLFHAVFDVAAAAVPEPGTYALIMAGLVMVGYVARRRSL